MKNKENFVPLSEIKSSDAPIELSENDLIEVKGGFAYPKGGNNCNCSCSKGSLPGTGENCNCSCPD